MLKLWLLGTGLLILGGMIWAFAPILVPVIAIAIGLGGLVALIVSIARKLERGRTGGPRA